MARIWSLSICLILQSFTTTATAYAKYRFRDKCLDSEPEKYVYNATRQIVTFVAAGTNLTFPDNDPSCNRSSQLVSADLCRVALSIPTSNRSSITFELWLPENWSGRFLATGNGGIDGCESVCTLMQATQQLPNHRLNE